MGAALQNFIISQGATLASQLTLQLPGIPTTDGSGGTVSGSKNVTVATTAAYSIGQSISGPGIPSNSIITQVVNSTNLTISQSSTITGSGVSLVIGAFNPINLTGAQFLFSAKSTVGLSDTLAVGQGVVEFNWTEITTNLLGQTWFTIPDTTTQQMAAGNWSYLIRLVGALGLSASLDLFIGVIAVTTPTSNRIS